MKPLTKLAPALPTPAMIIDRFAHATRMHNDTNDKNWGKESDRLAKVARGMGVTELELLNAWFELDSAA